MGQGGGLGQEGEGEGDGHQDWGDHGGSKLELVGELASVQFLLGPGGVSKLHAPEYPLQIPDSSEDWSGSGLLGVDGGVLQSW